MESEKGFFGRVFKDSQKGVLVSLNKVNIFTFGT